MEGVSHEACSLAGTLGLGKLIAVYDDNGVSIDGETKGWFTDDTPRRFAAYGWHVIANVDGHDVAAVDAALRAAQQVEDRPSLICCKTVIGKGAPTKSGTADAHGAALGEKEVAATRAALGWTLPPFEIPPRVYAGFDARASGALHVRDWQARFATYKSAFPDLAAEFERRTAGALPPDFASLVDAFVAQQAAKAESVATRKASQQAIGAYAARLPEMLGGSADLTGSVFTNWSGSTTVTRDTPGNYVYFGVREFGMAAIANGVALHGGFIPYHGTFLTFSDYMRNAVRMAALMKLRVIAVFTHDSIGLGEDGPTHQPVEHLAALRAIPNLYVFRPCDAVETIECWQLALERSQSPSVLALTRQNLPQLRLAFEETNRCAAGAYEIVAAEKEADVSLFATGSEVFIAVEACKLLRERGVAARVVSIPCFELLRERPAAERQKIVGTAKVKVAVEAAVRQGWDEIIGSDGAFVGMTTFGASAPYKDLYRYFGITPENVAKAALSTLGKT
jgi:transketolase